MNILHIGKYYPPSFGGIEKVSFDLVKTLNEKGINTDVLCFNHNPGTQVETKPYKIFRSSTITSAFSSPLSLSIFRILRQIQSDYDIIHLHLPNPMGAAALQSIQFKGKIILHWHSDIIRQKILKIFYKPFQIRLLKRADSIIVTSQNYLEGSKDLEPYRNKCTVIPIGISNSEFINNKTFRNEIKKKYEGKKVILSIGRLIYYKGFEYLVEAAKNLPTDYVVIIGGTGVLENKLLNQIQNSNLQNKVTLLGEIPFECLGEYYKRADVFCLPSIERSEAFGVVLIEAMSFGCPVISTNIPGSGVTWVNVHNETGLVVEPKNAKELARAIIKIIGNEIVRTKFSKNAISRYNSQFQLKLMTKRTIQLYNSLRQ